VPKAEDWRSIVAALRSAPDPATSPDLPRLYALALADGPLLLKSFRRRLGEDRIVDLVHDFLAANLGAVIAADEPRALFCVALQRRAISWLRRGDADVAADPSSGKVPAAPVDEHERHDFIVDARSALAGLPKREQEIVVAVALGEDREAVARAFGTSRSNVDQIVSRVRRRFASGTAK
jgi:DNA-directed RNA polymerase specialized sigma24 family protein